MGIKKNALETVKVLEVFRLSVAQGRRKRNSIHFQSNDLTLLEMLRESCGFQYSSLQTYCLYMSIRHIIVSPTTKTVLDAGMVSW